MEIPVFLATFEQMKSTPIYRLVLVWTMLGIYILSSVKTFQPYLNYKINYEYISTVLCENKEKPQMQCNGKCHLNKELKKAAEEEANNTKILVKLSETEGIIYNELNISFNISFELLSKKKYPSFAEIIHSFTLDHTSPPPRA